MEAGTLWFMVSTLTPRPPGHRDAGSKSELGGAERKSVYNDVILNAARHSWFLH